METTAQKIALRQEMREQLAELPLAAAREKSAAIRARLAGLVPWTAAEWVLAYLSRGREVDTHELIRDLLASGRHVCVPKFDETTQHYLASELRAWAADLAPGKFQILEPHPAAVRPVPFARLEALLVPGLAFDRAGHRLGRGRGYFDRILSATRGTKIALAYNFQVVSGVPVQRHDARVDFIVTETSTIACGLAPLPSGAGHTGRINHGEQQP